MGDVNQDVFLDWINNRILLLSDSYIGVKAHEISVEAEALKVEVKVLKKVRDKYLNINPCSHYQK